MQNAFSDYFASVTVSSNKRVPDFPIHNVPQLNSIDVDKQHVLNAIKKLKCNLSAGPDGLPPLLFRRVKNGIAFPLALMFKQMLSVAFIPDEWKTAVITPVHKKGPTEQVSNYRPISITCVPCKLLERIIANQIYRHLNVNNILCNEQHGFTHGKSTCTNLLETLNDWTLNLQNGFPTVVIYIDFSKAFDVVQHDKLFLKLCAVGISGDLLAVIKIA